MDRLASALLSPFWLIGRIFAALGVFAAWIWDAFNDGLNAGNPDDNETVDAVVAFLLIWAVVLTVMVVFF